MAEPPDLADLKDQLAVETLIADVSATLAATTDQAFASALETALEMTARFSGADRGQLLSVHAPQCEVRVLHAWCAASVESPGGGAPALNLAEHTPWAADLVVTRRQPLVISALDELPREAHRDRAWFAARGVRSAVWVPIAIGSDLRYMLAIEATHGEVRWPRALVRRLPRLGGILGHTVERKRIADAIRETDARITLATSSADTGPWGLDLSTGRIWATPAAKELHGFAADAEITFDQFLSVVHPEDVDRVRERVSRTAVEGADFADEYRVVLPGGAIRWIAVRGRAHAALDGSGPHVFGMSVEVTPRKLAEAAHRAARARLEAAVDGAGLGFYVMTHPGDAADLDDRTRAIFGVPPEEEPRLRTFWLEHVHPDDRDRILQASRDIKEEGVERVSHVYRYQHPTRGLIWVQHTTRTFERDESGRPARVAGVLQDITEQKHTEWELRESAARLAAAAELAGLGFYDLDFSTGVGFVDDRCRDLCGIPPGPLKGLEIVDLWRERLHPDDRPRIAELLPQRHAEKLDRVSFEYRILHPARGERWLRHVASVVGPKGPAAEVRSFGVIQDVTERRQIEETLRQSCAETERLKDRLQAESDYLKAEIKVVQAQHEIVGQSAAIRKVLGLVEQVAPMDSSVLIYGETGTGKELVAQAIHRLSPRARHVMVKVSCAALPAGLVESELFGREKGAFTGALTRQVGRFELADGSTLFLDEVGELSPEVQVKLLRVLEEGEFQRLGSPKTITVNVRLIAATHRDLADEVRKGRFREDLYYRLNVFPIHVPPLRQRAEDIPPLVWSFLRDLCERMGKKITQVPRATMEALQRYPWPGNVRELRNVIEHGAIVSTKDTLVVPMLAEAGPAAMHLQALADIERAHIRRVLESTGWRIKGPKGAAAALGLNYGTLYGRMKKLGIRRQE